MSEGAHRRLVADLALVFVTVIWGSTFVMVKSAVATYPTFSFLTLRFTLAALALLPFVWFEQRRARMEERSRQAAGALSYQAPLLRRPVAPLLIGLALFAGYACQTLGLQLTTPAKAGFITGTYVVIVPLVTALLLRQRPGRNAELGVGLAMIGLALLSLRAGLSVNPGDALVLGCALAFAAHILLTGRFAPRYDPMLLTLGQIVVVAGLSGACALALEPRVALNREVLFAAAFTGLLATSAAFGIQVMAQRFTTSTHTALDFRRRIRLCRTGELPAHWRSVGAAATAGLRDDPRWHGRSGAEGDEVGMARSCSGAPLGSRLVYTIARLFYRLIGWHAEAVLPDLPKYVVIIAPHTSNLDGLLAFTGEAIITCGFHTVKLSWLGKHTLFRWPSGYLMRWLGGIAVDRRSRHALVDQAVQAFNERTNITLAITPEGMRKKSRYWKTGFYYVALGAQVPIQLAYVDYRHKVVGTGPLIMPSGDIQADMATIRAFYQTITARHPERVGRMEVPPAQPQA